MTATREEDLYEPVKAFLEGQGYAVKAEVRGCDLVARRGEEPPVIVELKKAFNLALLLQGVDRLAMSEQVYLAFGAPAKALTWRRDRKSVLKLCRRLGLGLLMVHPEKNLVEPLLDPLPYQPRPNRKRQALLLKEFARRVGDPNTGGQTRRPIVTAYRQDALRCAALLDAQGPTKAAAVAAGTGVSGAAPLMRRDVYGWFLRVERGIYALSPKGREALTLYADVVAELNGKAPARMTPARRRRA
ncbi:DUF2161 family putative PD-(D/E)XK-type phosphodiesterase [Pelagibius marinus]|uniref:DUF2161 family putative PD-(D/E)XK-type phosphodiesterase n=1 Tax=Pelagibius marinus TaxID=2762760 RepID=UPI001873166E|nr:DUF2161 family putative PD-(D/E)XK-type phosphodiesterase [Pelagibius marinus]